MPPGSFLGASLEPPGCLLGASWCPLARIEAIDAIEAIKAIEAIEGIEGIGAIEAIEAINDSGLNLNELISTSTSTVEVLGESLAFTPSVG